MGFHAISQKTLVVQDWYVSADIRQFLLALFTFLYVDIIDCTATLYSMARFAGVIDSNTKDFPRSTLAYCTDAFFISVGSLFGVSPITVFVESGAGVNQGGKTGLTAITTGLCFCVSIFFAPIFASIPPWATGCTLILVSLPTFKCVSCLPVSEGRLYDDAPSHTDQLELYWRYRSCFCHDGLYASHIFCRLRSYCVSLNFIFRISDRTNFS